ncbi:MAG: leucyl/phenylalanyl-tRNA--protein transferase [Proteobacteria bacterium]|nr:MAG: leucyl/phenylalanyl-tRNA--protein transferase [Pseudomonadota bacterium]
MRTSGRPSSEFPPLEHATPEGLLAIGGDLSPQRLIEAYSLGIFPWYNPGQPILWWSPDPRAVLFPDELIVSRSLRKTLRHHGFTYSMDRAFAEVVRACAEPRRQDTGASWITSEMERAYCALHDLRIAHSVEVWRDGRLVGGLYGVAMGTVFFGESMFTRESNASKSALAVLVGRLLDQRFELIDCQVESAHLASLGARLIPRREFAATVREGLRTTTPCETWTFEQHYLEPYL